MKKITELSFICILIITMAAIYPLLTAWGFTTDSCDPRTGRNRQAVKGNGYMPFADVFSCLGFGEARE